MQCTLHDIHCAPIQIGLSDMVSGPSFVIFRKYEWSSADYLPDLVVLCPQEHLHPIFSVCIVRSIKIWRLVDRMTFSHIASILHYTFNSLGF